MSSEKTTTINNVQVTERDLRDALARIEAASVPRVHGDVWEWSNIPNMPEANGCGLLLDKEQLRYVLQWADIRQDQFVVLYENAKLGTTGATINADKLGSGTTERLGKLTNFEIECN